MPHYTHKLFESQLLSASTSFSLDKAAREWTFESCGHSGNSRPCQICNTPMKQCIVLRNVKNDMRLVIGCNCYDKFRAYLKSGNIESQLPDRRTFVRDMKTRWKKILQDVSPDGTFLGWLQSYVSHHLEETALRDAVQMTSRLGFPPNQQASDMIVGCYKQHRKFAISTLLQKWERQMLIDRNILDINQHQITIDQADSLKSQLISRVREELQESWVCMRETVPDETLDARYNAIEDALADALEKNSSFALESAMRGAVSFSQELSEWKSAPVRHAFIIPGNNIMFYYHDYEHRWIQLFARTFPTIDCAGVYEMQYIRGKAWVYKETLDTEATIPTHYVLTMLRVEKHLELPSKTCGADFSDLFRRIQNLDSLHDQQTDQNMTNSFIDYQCALRGFRKRIALKLPYNSSYIEHEVDCLLEAAHQSPLHIQDVLLNIQSAIDRYQRWESALTSGTSVALVVPRSHYTYALILHDQRWSYRRIALHGRIPDQIGLYTIITYGDYYSEGGKTISRAVIVDATDQYSDLLQPITMNIASSRENGGWVGRTTDGTLAIPYHVIKNQGRYLCFLKEKKPKCSVVWVIQEMS